MADPHSMEYAAPSDGGAAGKRRRRPSVRLGEIGAATHPNSPPRRSKQFKIPPHEDGAADEGYRDSQDREDLGNSRERNSNPGFLTSLEEGSVRAWLNGLGLGRYLPVFQIHEVDDEVLPFLTLEDLKEMGITAVGSRRKIFCAIQKLWKREKQLAEDDLRSIF